jgi:hypothetical protein
MCAAALLCRWCLSQGQDVVAAAHAGDLPAAQAHLGAQGNATQLARALRELFRGWHEALGSTVPPAASRLSGYPPIFALLVEAGVNTSASCPLGPLLQAVRNRNLVGLRLLLESFPREALPRCLATPDASGSVLLHYAARSPAPGLARIFTALRGHPPQSTASVAQALGISGGLLPPWTPSGVMLRGTLEASAGSPEVHLLQPSLTALEPAQRAVALTARNLIGETPLSIACSHGRVAFFQWLVAELGGAGLLTVEGARDCRGHLAASGYGAAPVWAAALGAVEQQAAAVVVAPGSGEAAAVRPQAGSGGAVEPPPSLPAMHSPPNALPPSFSTHAHLGAGWGVMSPGHLSALGFPGNLFEEGGSSAGGGARGNYTVGTPCDELPLSALSPEGRGALEEAYLRRGKPFVIRASWGRSGNSSSSSSSSGAPVIAPSALERLLGGRGTRLSVGGVPYASEYGRGGGDTEAGEFISRHMRGGSGGEGGGETPLIFDSAFLKTEAAAALGAMFARRRASVFPAPPGLSQLIIGPPGSGSALHFHPAAVNFLVLGVKAWVLGAPSGAGFADASAGAWWGGAGREELAQALAPLEGGGYFECLQGPGDMVYIPSQWGHAVMNLADTVALAYESLL